MTKLIEKHNIKEEDLFKISCLQQDSKEAGFWMADEINAQIAIILRPYYELPEELVAIKKEISNVDYYNDQDLADKYDKVDITHIKEKLKKKFNLMKLFGVLLVVFSIFTAILTSSSECDCMEYMMELDSSIDNHTLYLNCLDKYYDEAFDYAEANNLNGNYQNYEAVIEHYWAVKCDKY